VARTDQRSGTLVDSNVLIDILSADPVWTARSERALADATTHGPVVINVLIYAELAAGFDSAEALEDGVSFEGFERLDVPWEAGFLAGKAHARYRRRGGRRRMSLPDFFIGAHAAVAGLRLLTRDPRRYREYFPTVELLTP